MLTAYSSPTVALITNLVVVIVAVILIAWLASVFASRRPPASSTADELAKLAELHAAGALTGEEFASAKGQLLRP